MFKTGMTTVTFTALSATENIDIAVRAGLDGLEWADKYHVLSGDTETARKVGQQTRQAGLEVLSYGSFYNPFEHDFNYFLKTLACARELETDTIRIWAGNRGSAVISEDERRLVTASLRAACTAAEPFGIMVAVEYHPRTLTDTSDSTLRLIREVGRPNFRTYWQQSTLDIGTNKNIAQLREILAYVSNIHVFAWDHCRLPLAKQSSEWRIYLDILRQTSSPHALLIEFVHDSRIETLISDVESLKEWVANDKK